jgi:hypothetical protein
MRCFIAIAFQLCFRLCHCEGLKHQEGLKLSGTHLVMVCADYVNLLSEIIHTVRTQNLLRRCRTVSLHEDR